MSWFKLSESARQAMARRNQGVGARLEKRAPSEAQLRALELGRQRAAENRAATAAGRAGSTAPRLAERAQARLPGVLRAAEDAAELEAAGAARVDRVRALAGDAAAFGFGQDGGSAHGLADRHVGELSPGSVHRVRRVGALEDARLRIAPELRAAGQAFARIAHDAARLGAVRGVLSELAGDGRAPADPDKVAATRRRLIAAEGRLAELRHVVPGAPCVATPNGNLSEWQILLLVVVEGRSIVSVACGKGRRYAAVRAALESALRRLEPFLREA